MPHEHCIFLLSPANSGGERARMVLNGGATFDLAFRLQGEGAPLGEVFSFVSSLYFRGKLAYAQTFATPPPGVPGSLVITPSHGLVRPEKPVTLGYFEMAEVPVNETGARYRMPLERDARLLADAAGSSSAIVLLGSIATGKYIETLLEVFGERLLFPEAFVGRGDMSRGGLLLRAARSGEELEYARSQMPFCTDAATEAAEAAPHGLITSRSPLAFSSSPGRGTCPP